MINLYKSLDFNKVLENLAFFATTEKAKQLIIDQKPLNDKEIILRKLNEIEELINLKKISNISFDFYFKDVTFLLDLAKKGQILSISEIIEVNKVLLASIYNKNILNSQIEKLDYLEKYIKSLLKEPQLSTFIKNNFLSNNEISSRASFFLEDIRKKIDEVNDEIRKTLISYTKKSKYSEYLQTNTYTIKNDRYCLLVKTEYKRLVPGIVHEQSNTKSTTYVEPFEILEKNNLLKELQSQEQEEIQRILKDTTKHILRLESEILITQDALVNLDIINAKTEYSIKYNAVKPEITYKKLSLLNAKHPLIDQTKVVPVTVEISENKPVLVISGHNTGGKTATLKLIGVSALLLKTGMFIQAEKAELPIFNKIFLDIGDEQSIENELSTFSSHITKIKEIINQAKDKDLILLDELAMGTDPEEGQALAVSIFDYLVENEITTVITTHYRALKEKAKNSEKAEIATMEYDTRLEKSTYKLIKGHKGLSNAILIAKKLGLQQNIIDNAEKFLPKEFIKYKEALEEVQELNLKLQKENEYILKLKKEEELKLAQINKQIELFEKEKEKFEKSIERERIRKVDKLKEEAQEIVDQLKEIQKNQNDAEMFKAYKLNKTLQNISTNEKDKVNKIYNIDNSEIKINDTVVIKKLDQEAKVIDIKQNKVTLILNGGIKLVQNKKDLVKIFKQEEKEEKIRVKKEYNFPKINASYEINIIGSTTDEVEDKLSKFLDDAVFSGLNSVRIVHGKGTGALRAKVHQYLKSLKFVKSFKLARELEGDTGVTLVELQ